MAGGLPALTADGTLPRPVRAPATPFRPADDGWRDSLDWYGGYPSPYGHQAAAFKRLSSLESEGSLRRPLPTLVTTGTGSGKTESFLYPILDHVLRAKRAGLGGIKAVILYPMNALANDQAKRLTELLTTNPDLHGVTAALYTGQQGSSRSKVSAAGLITDREIIRDTPPDILLTNYKMLDQLLLRHADAKLWSASARSLQYLVLDEFHTYDGAQGTDVAMLIRRLGLALKAHWPTEPEALADAGFTDADVGVRSGGSRPSARPRRWATRATRRRCWSSPGRCSARTSRKSPSSRNRACRSPSGLATQPPWWRLAAWSSTTSTTSSRRPC